MAAPAMTASTAGSDLVYYNLGIDGQFITGFDTRDPAAGGDMLTVAALLGVPTMALADAVAQGYLSFADDGAGATCLLLDADGSAGAGGSATLCTFTDLAFVDAATAETQFADNITIF
jgi:hypothetical protein